MKRHINNRFARRLALMLAIILTFTLYATGCADSNEPTVDEQSSVPKSVPSANAIEPSSNTVKPSTEIPSETEAGHEEEVSSNPEDIESAQGAPAVTSAEPEVIPDNSTFEVHYIDVGQADAVLVLCDGQAMLIDGGNAADSNLIYAYLSKLSLNHLEYIVCTHAHEDHVGGLSGALNYATVDVAFSPVTSYDSKAFGNFVTYLERQNVYIYNAVKDHVDTVEQMPNGTLVAIKKGANPGPRVMVTAHMDEVGYEVKSISPKGFLYFDAVGIPTTACLPGRRVLVKGEKGVVQGVVGVRSAHLLTPEQMSKPQTVGQSYVDICVDSKEEAQALGIDIGAQIVPYSPCPPMGPDGDYMGGRAVDDRALCALMIETLIELSADDLCGEIIAVFNILEEATVHAIAAPVSKYDPEYGLFLDTIPCGDVPDCDFDKELPVALKKGPVIVLTQALAEAALRSVSHPKLVAALREAVEETGAPHQEIAFSGAGYVTDAVSATYAGTGMAVATLAMPRRYSHAPVEVFHMSDMLATQAVVERFLKKKVDISML